MYSNQSSGHQSMQYPQHQQVPSNQHNYPGGYQQAGAHPQHYQGQ